MSKPSQQNNLTLEQLPETVKKLSQQLEEAQAALEKKQIDLSSVTAKVVEKERVLRDLETSIEAKQLEADAIRKSLEKDVTEAESRLKQLYFNGEKAIEVYKKVTAETEAARKDIAERTLSLDKREEVVVRKETALQDAEGRVADLHRLMKL